MPRDHLFGEVDRLELLERRIREDGAVLPGGILKVDSFLNHQMDTALFHAMAEEFYTLYSDCGVKRSSRLRLRASGLPALRVRFSVALFYLPKRARPAIWAATFTPLGWRASPTGT